MVGTGETYLPAFVLALTSSELACGLVASVPLIAGAFLQLVSPYLVRHVRSYRRWVVLCAVVQAAALLLLCLVATVESLPVIAVFALASFYWGAGMAGAPAWNTWVGALVPRRLRARFFARRTRLGQLGLFASFLVAGIALQIGSKLGYPMTAFALVFLAAVGSRFLSAFYLNQQRDVHSAEGDCYSLQLRGLFRSFKQDANGSLLAYLLAAQVGVQISAPYFNPYMLGQLQMSYLQYMFLAATAYAAKIAFLPALGRLADRWGATQVLWTSGLLIAALPAMWLISDKLVYLFVLQVYSGAIWAGFDLAMLLLFFETISAEKRIAILTIFNLANATAIVLGSLLGGLILAILGPYREVYLVIFLVSSIVRGAALILLVRMPHVKVAAVPIPTRSLALRPALGSMDRPILAGMDRPREETPCKDTPGAIPSPMFLRSQDQLRESTLSAAESASPPLVL